MKDCIELVFIPSPAMGHLVSAVETAKLFLHHKYNLSVSVLIMKMPFQSHLDSYVDSLLSTNNNNYGSRLKFIQLSNNGLPNFTEHTDKVSFVRSLYESHKPSVRECVEEIKNSDSARFAGFVVDIFCTTLVDEFAAPTYVFYTSGAATLGIHLHFQSLRDDHGVDVTEFKDSDIDLNLPTYLNPFPAKLLPEVMVDNTSGASTMILDIGKLIRGANGILVNTFFELEEHALKALFEDERVPPVYPVGPILNLKGSSDDMSEKEILNWLDDQPESSVVFLCFGSGGSFSEPQAKEIAHALERSGYRFLWALRQPPREGSVVPTDYNDLEKVLPEGFLDRTKSIGKVIGGWAPQAAVLAHPAVSGFISHCGWNSTLESVWFGVPMATWPMSAEQHANAFQLVTDIGMGVEVKMDYKPDSIVNAKEIGIGITSLMDHPATNAARIKANELKQKSRKALEEGGSSLIFIERFFEQVMNNQVNVTLD